MICNDDEIFLLQKKTNELFTNLKHFSIQTYLQLITVTKSEHFLNQLISYKIAYKSFKYKNNLL